MKALVYHGAQTLSVSDIPIPPVGKGDVLIQVLYCGVCGTDKHIYHGDGGAFDVSPPLIMGHEFSGYVADIGPGVTKVQAGDPVSVDPNSMCGSCYFCRNAQEQFCENVVGIGTTRDGGFAEYCVVPEKQVYRLHKEADMLAAALCEPLSCCLHGIDLCHIKLGDTVLIIGCGPIGLIMLQLAKLAGASRLIVSEPVAEKRALAERLGADLTVDPSAPNASELIAAYSKNINVVIECVGNVHTMKSAVEWAGFAATIMLFGLTGGGTSLSVDPDILFKKELKLTSSFINPYTFSRAVTLAESGRLRLNDIIGQIVLLEDAPALFADPHSQQKGKSMIKLTR